MAINHHPHSAFLRPIVTLALLLCMAVEANAYTYRYYIINKKGWTGLWFKETTQTAGNAPYLPDWMRSPLVEKYYYYDDSRVTHTPYTNGSDGRPNTECYYHNGSKVVTDDTVLPGKYEYLNKTNELTALPANDANIFVFYDVKSSTMIGNTYIDLSGKLYYNIQDYDNWYIYANELWKDSWGQYQVCSNSLNDLHTWHHRNTKLNNTDSSKDNQSYGDLQYDETYAKSIQPNFSFMLWRFEPVDGNIDPYNFYIKNKMYDEQNNFANTRVLSEENHAYNNSWSESKQTESNQRKAYMYEPTANTSSNYYIKTFALIGNAENVHLVSNSIYLYRTTQTYPSIRNLGYRSFQITDRHKEGISIINGDPSNDVNAQIMNPKWSIKLTQDRPTTFNMVDLNGRIVLKWQKKISDDSDISVPASLQSPLAKNFKFYKKTAFTIQGDKFTLTTPSEEVSTVSDISYGDEVFVTYAYNEDPTILDITGNTVTSIKCDDKYLYVENNGDPTIKAAADQTKSNYRWILDNASVNGVVDPYNILVSNMTNTTTFMSGSTANESLALSNSNTNNRFALLKDSNGNLSFVVSGVSVDTYFDYEHLYVTLNEDGTMTLKQQGYDEATTVNQHLTFTPQTTSKVTYHVMNLSGSEAISYSADIVEGDNTINMPSILKSSLAENYTFYSDKACTNEITSLTTGMNDIYVKYTSKQDLILDLSGNTSYSFKLGGQEDPQMWTLTAQTVDGYYDPYNVSIKDSNGNTLMNASFCILSGIYSESFILMKAKNGDAGTNQYLALGAEGQMEWKEIGDTKISDNNIQAIFGKNITYHFKKLNGEGFRDITLMSKVAMNTTNVIPSEIMTSLAKDYHYYSDSELTQEITDANNLPSDIYVTYSFNESLTTIDLSGDKDFLAANTYGQFLYYNGTTLTFLNTDNSTGEILWNINGKDGGSLIDPYAVSVINASVNNTFLSVDDNGTMICDNSGTPKTYMITTTADGKLKFVDMSPQLSSFTLSLTEVTHSTYDYTFYIINKKGWTGLWYNLKGQSSDGKIELPNFMRSQLVSTYHYYSTEQVKHTDDYDKGRPLYKCRYGNNTNISTNTTLAGLYERGTEELTSWPRKNADIFVFYDVKPDKERIIDGVHIDLNGKSYYNIQDRFGSYVFMDKRYVKDSKSEDSQIFSYEYENLQKYLGVTSKTDAQMMWSFYSANDDPYDVQMKNKMISQTYSDFVVVESDEYNNAACPDCWPTSLGGDGDTHSDWSKGKKVYVLTPEMSQSDYGKYFRINSFAFLQGTSADTIRLAGSIVGKVTKDKLQSFRYFGLRGYPNVRTINGMTNVYYGLMRGESDTDVNKYLNNDLYRVQLTEYSDILTYHVINLSGKEATSISEYYAAGNPCGLSGMVRSPFATNYKYYKAEDIKKADDGTITINADAVPLTTIPAGTKEIYVTYEYDAANTTGINIAGRNGSFIYNISSNSKYLTTNGTTLSTATASSTNKGCLWVIECNMVNGMPDPYDAHIYSWSNYEKYLGGETTLSLTDKAGSTSFILGRGTNSSLFTLAKVQAVNEVDGAQKMTYLSCDGSSFSFSQQVASSSTVQTSFVNSNVVYTYHIINLSKEKSLYKVADDLMSVHVPYELSSPALAATDYHYYASNSFDDAYNLKEGAQQITSLKDLPDGEFNIYVTYTYDKTTSPYDLTGATEYSFIMNDGSYAAVKTNTADNNIYAPKQEENGTIKPGNDNASICTIYDAKALWTLQGEDPYKVRVYNSYRNDSWMASTDNKTIINIKNSDTNVKMTHFAILNMTGGNLRVVGVPYSYTNTEGTNSSAAWYCLNTNTGQSRISLTKMSADLGNTSTKIVARIKHDYTYHVTSKVDNQELTVRKPGYEGAPVSVPFELSRHFCTYKYYSDASMQSEVTHLSTDYDIYIDYTVQDGIFIKEGEKPEDHPESLFFMESGIGINATYNTFNSHWYVREEQYVMDEKSGENFMTGNLSTCSTLSNRFSQSSPNLLKFFFRGDPYHLQVYGYNLSKGSTDGQLLVPMSRNEYQNVLKYKRDVYFVSTQSDRFETLKAKGFHWEMVDSRLATDEKAMSFALRFKEVEGRTVKDDHGDSYTERELDSYYYLRSPRSALSSKPEEAGIANAKLRLEVAKEGETSTVIIAGLPTEMHTANVNECTITLRCPATIRLTVYKEGNVASPVTRNELSEFYAVGEKFSYIPDNLKKQFCEYAIVDADDPGTALSNTLFEVTKPSYKGAHYMYAKYKVVDYAPFTCLTSDDDLALMTDKNTKWFNVQLDGDYGHDHWMYFDRNYIGLNSSGQPNEKVIVPLEGIDIYTHPDRLHKGIQWAFVGDPYDFYMVNRRSRTAVFDTENKYKIVSQTPGYFGINNESSKKEIMVVEAPSYANSRFTFMMNPSGGGYFFSYSEPRKKAQSEDSGNMNIWVSNADSWKLCQATSGGNYSYGHGVRLERVNGNDDPTIETAEKNFYGAPMGNEVFDCILNVYNDENRVVATTGWTELLRNSTADDMLPLDIKRYGCRYTCWADATMANKKVTELNETVRRDSKNDWDGTGDPSEMVYLLEDGCVLFTSYKYDQSVYSSENNYRWMNCHYDWQRVSKKSSQWRRTVTEFQRNAGSQNDKWYGDKWSSYLKNETTEDYTRYVKMPSAPDENDKTDGESVQPVGNVKDRDVVTETNEQNLMKWAFIGDPYEFQIKNYMYKSGIYTNHYLYTGDDKKPKFKEQETVKIDITDDTPVDQVIQTELTVEQKQGFTYTYKVDIVDGEEVPYLALKDEYADKYIKQSANDRLIGAVKSYISFNSHQDKSQSIDVPDNETVTLDGVTYTKNTAYEPKDDIYSAGSPYSGSVYTEEGVYEYSGEGIKYFYLKKQLPFTDEEGNAVKKSIWVPDNNEQNENNWTLTSMGGVSSDVNTLQLGGAKAFYVVPMTTTAKKVVFNLKYYRSKEETGYPTTSTESLLMDTYFKHEDGSYDEYPVTKRPAQIKKNDGIVVDDYLSKPYEIADYGVGNDLQLPWSYRRQFCDYFYKLVKVEKVTVDGSANESRTDVSSEFTSLIGQFYTELIPELANYVVTFDVYYKTRSTYQSSDNADNAYWYNLTTRVSNSSALDLVNFTYTNDLNRGNREHHYTDDWLWALDGDPYGLQIHNRYAKWDEVLAINNSTLPDPVTLQDKIDQITGEMEGTVVFNTISASPSSASKMTFADKSNTHTFFEMMEGNYSDAFIVHPINAEVLDKYPAFFISFFMFNAGAWPVQLNEMYDRDVKRNLSANWMLSQITKDQLYVYYERRGYVGALTPDKATEDEVKTLFGKLKDGSATYADLKQAQKIVHNKANLVPLKKGYYRIKAMSDEALTAYEADKTQYSGTRYASAFLTKSELSEDGKSSDLPLNFWATLADNQGDLNYSDLPADQLNQSYNRELLAAEYDPSSIFYFVPTLAEGETVSDQTKWTVTSQGININNIPYIDDIGGTLFTMRSGTDMKTGYLNCSPDTKRFALNTGTDNELHEKYDIQDTKWLLQPVGDQGYAMPLKFETLDGGDGYKYCSAYLSHDIQLSDNAEAWVADGEPYENGERKRWEVLCKKIGEDASFVPALTPVIIRCPYEKPLYATIPNDAPTPNFYAPSATSPLYGSLFAREVGDDTLATESEKNAVNTGNEVYVFGKANGTAYFYLNGNANPHNANAFDTKYLYHNKAFLIETPAINASPLRVCVPVFSNMSSGIDNVYVDDDKDKGPIYDLQGRKVKKTKRGVYIQDKKKFVVVGSYAK